MRSFIDTNVFVYATYSRYPQHTRAKDFLKTCLAGSDFWYLSWTVIYEYLAVVTQPKIYEKPVTLSEALVNAMKFTQSPRVEILRETMDHETYLQKLPEEPRTLAGSVLHDAHHVALMREHDLTKIITADTDFHRFKGIEVVNPFKN